MKENGLRASVLVGGRLSSSKTQKMFEITSICALQQRHISKSRVGFFFNHQQKQVGKARCFPIACFLPETSPFHL
jgi:hypothetical protein